MCVSNPDCLSLANPWLTDRRSFEIVSGWGIIILPWAVPKAKRRVPGTERVTLCVSDANIDRKFSYSATYGPLTPDGTPHAQSGAMKTNNTLNNQLESTYSLLVRSEEKGRGVLEVAVFVAFVVSIVFSICQFVQTPVTTPAAGTKPCVACHFTKSDLRAGS